MNNIVINIANKDRPTELALLLQSLRTQFYKNFDIVILDDGSGTPIMNYYFLQYIINRMKLEGNNVTILRNETNVGVSNARQQLVDFSLKNKNYKYIVRIDDDSICDNRFIEKLLEGTREYDIVGCLVPHFPTNDIVRDIEIVKPIIGECKLNNNGELIMNYDDCGTLFNKECILPSHHFRSSCLFKREIFECGVNYSNRLSKNGFREEQIISFKAILKGFKIGIHTGAICWHLATPSGGERDTMNMTQFNQERFDETVKRMFEDNGGDFISGYNKRLGIVPKERTKTELLKSTNLVYKKEDVSLI